ncbi:hypothetical protein D3C87_1848340 [compost metagenome]
MSVASPDGPDTSAPGMLTAGGTGGWVNHVDVNTSTCNVPVAPTIRSPEAAMCA